MPEPEEICIIDDDAIAVFGLRRALKAIDIRTEPMVFENGLDAIENFRKRLEDDIKLPKMIFLDVNMPVMDGWDFMIEFTNLSNSEKDNPDIFVMTSSIDIKDVQKARKYGLESSYLIKPVSTEVLGRILNRD